MRKWLNLVYVETAIILGLLFVVKLRIVSFLLFCCRVMKLVSWISTFRKTCVKFHQMPSVHLTMPAPCCLVRAARLICEYNDSMSSLSSCVHSVF